MRRLIVPSALAVLGLGAAFALLRSGTPLHPGATPALPVLVTEQARVRVVTLTDGLNQPWALAFLPGGDMLITERGGRMRLMYDGRLASGSIGGLPAVDTRTQDGLMDLALHPRFVQNQLLYFTYSQTGRARRHHGACEREVRRGNTHRRARSLRCRCLEHRGR